MTTTDLNLIKKAVHKHFDTLRSIYHVKHIGIFGSTARGDNRKASDVDMLVELTEPVGFFKFVELEEFLSQILKKRVDLVTNNALKPAIKEQILEEVIYV